MVVSKTKGIKVTKMEYEILDMNEKIIAGLCARTNNSASDMSQVIGGLWTRLYGEGLHLSMPNKANDKSVVLYSDYASDASGDYDITVGFEVTTDDRLPEGLTVKRIPAGRYAKFIVKGDMHQAVSDFWQALWTMDLDRAYTGDYEEYQNSDMEQAEIHMYIALR